MSQSDRSRQVFNLFPEREAEPTPAFSSNVPGQLTPLLERLKAYLKYERLLLLLDNFEHLLETVPVVTELLTACPNVKVLATSRERLYLSGEHEFPVPPLERQIPDLPRT